MMLHKKRTALGCFSSGISTHKIANLTFAVCPSNYYNSSIDHLWKQFTLFEKNLLPYIGTIDDQPAKILEVFSIIQGIISEEEKRIKQVAKLKELKNKQIQGMVINKAANKKGK